MGHDFSLSVFTIEINGTPTVALQAKRHHEAEQFCEQDVYVLISAPSHLMASHCAMATPT